MFLKRTIDGDLVEVLDLKELFDPFVEEIKTKTQAGEDTMDVCTYTKSDLIFPSGEMLPLCWRDSHYREHMA